MSGRSHVDTVKRPHSLKSELVHTAEPSFHSRREHSWTDPTPTSRRRERRERLAEKGITRRRREETSDR